MLLAGTGQDPASWALWAGLIVAGSMLISLGVHFIPVGGAPAAMAQATGIGTGTVQLALGSGLTGLISAGAMMQVTDDIFLILASGMAGSMLMLAITMTIASMIYVFGTGCPPASAKVKYDPVTKDRQDLYVSKGTEGHGLPTVCFISGLIGSALGGIGGSLIYYSLVKLFLTFSNVSDLSYGMVSFIAVSLFFINAVIPSYNIGGTIEGFHDPKFKKWPKAVFTSMIVTAVCIVLLIIPVYAGGI